MFILGGYYIKAGDSAFVGVLIIILIYSGLLLMNTLIFYNYLVFLHMEGRLIDIYTRVTADPTYFFVPLDNEVSARYLRWVIQKVKIDNAAALKENLLGTKHFAITYHEVTDPEGNYKKNLTHITIYRKRDDGKLVMYRHFVKTGDGAICELDEGVPFTVDEHPLLDHWPNHVRRFLGSQTPSVAPEEEKDNGAFLRPSMSSRKPTDNEAGGTYRMVIEPETPIGEKKDTSSFLEPQVVLIKND